MPVFKRSFIFIFSLFILASCFRSSFVYSQIIVGAEQPEQYIQLLHNKPIALVVNQTSRIGNRHLVDSLLSLHINIKQIFSPEHGFRGNQEAGQSVTNQIDSVTQLPIISLYGTNKKPTTEQLADIDIVVFDIQDVGARFYTYISTLHYIMEACAENNKLLIIFDRPNPNGDYVDGPILKNEYQSFVGMHPIPIVHGLTMGELASMINGEKWLKDSLSCLLQVIPVRNYTHRIRYTPPIPPSPNLPNDISIRLYPSLCLFEGTEISVARGTRFPFQAFGSPNPKNGTFSFTPQSIPGTADHPMYEGQLCYGKDLRSLKIIPRFTLQYLIEMYKINKNSSSFFNAYFEKLIGNEELKQHIIQGWNEEKIRKTWEEDLKKYKLLRKKYLLYPDFE